MYKTFKILKIVEMPTKRKADVETETRSNEMPNGGTSLMVGIDWLQYLGYAIEIDERYILTECLVTLTHWLRA